MRYVYLVCVSFDLHFSLGKLSLLKEEEPCQEGSRDKGIIGRMRKVLHSISTHRVLYQF